MWNRIIERHTGLSAEATDGDSVSLPFPLYLLSKPRPLVDEILAAATTQHRPIIDNSVIKQRRHELTGDRENPSIIIGIEISLTPFEIVP